MPKAAPTQVIVHRIELQSSERELLKTFLGEQSQNAKITAASNAFGPVAIGAGVFGAGWVAVKGWAVLTAALNGILPDIEAHVAQAFAKNEDKTMTEKISDWTPLPSFGIGRLWDDLFQLAPDGSPVDDLGNLIENVQAEGDKQAWSFINWLFDPS